MNELKQQIEKKAFHCEGGMECHGGWQAVILVSNVLGLLADYEKQLQDHLEAMPEPLDKKYEYQDVNGLKQIRLYEFLPDLRVWKKKLEELLGKEKPK